jgi:ACS family glucarate transporter-like MFS transporter
MNPTASSPTTVRYRVLAWACSLSLLTYIDRVCIKQVEGDISRDLGLSTEQFSWVFAAFAVSYAIFEVPTGWLGDRLGPRRVLTRIVLWWSAFTALTGMVWRFRWETDGLSGYVLFFDSWLLLVLIRFLFGIGEAGAYPNLARGLRSWFPFHQRGRTQGLVWMFARWGGAVAPPLIAFFAHQFGWRGAFYAFGAIGALWAAFFWMSFRDRPEEHPDVNDAEKRLIRTDPNAVADEKRPLSWSTMLSSRTLWLLSIMYFCSNAGWYFFITWDRRYYESVLHLSGNDLVIASSAPLFAGGFACILGGLLTDRLVGVLGRRWGRTLQGAVAYLLGGQFFLLAMVVRDPILSVVLLCIASFVKDFAMGVSWATCLDIGHRYSGTVSGFMNMVGNLGGAVSSVMVARLAKQGDWNSALAFSGTMFLIAGVCWLFIEPRRVVVYEEVS